MKTRIFASIIIAAALASSAAQAGTTDITIEERYSGTLPSVTVDDYGLGSYYVESKPAPTCTQYDLDPLSIVYPEKKDAVSDYLFPQASHVVCLRDRAHS